MRLSFAAFCLAALLWVLGWGSGPAPEDDVLGDVVVEPTPPDRGGPNLMRVIVDPVGGDGPRRDFVEKILRRDLDLSGQFAFVEGSAEARVHVSVEKAEVVGRIFFDVEADVPAHEVRLAARETPLRATTHRLVDDLMAALTGYRGPFVSRLSFIAQRGDTRSLYVIDPDGYELRRVTDDSMLVSTSALGPEDVLYYAASVRNGRFRVYREGVANPLVIDPAGSVYGIGFSPDRARVALTIASGADVRLHAGPSDFSELAAVGNLPLALSPAISARGRIAVAGTHKVRPRIWVDGRPASSRGFSASAPAFCEHPDGPRLVYASAAGGRSDIIVARPGGQKPQRISRGRGRHTHPACSPDGRLVAFFSDRKSGDGPGLYVMRIDGFHPRKIATLRGHALTWSRVGVAAPGAKRAFHVE